MPLAAIALRMWVGSYGRPEHALFSNVQLVSGIIFIALLLEAAPRFSAYMYAEAWHIAFGALPHYELVAAFDGVSFGDSDLALLRREFAAGPRNYGWAGCFGATGLVAHRFERPGQRMRVAAHPEESEWWLAAESAGSLKRLV
jgi:hypothetical protein